MRQLLVTVLALVSMSLAGCSGGSGDTDDKEVTCPDGTVVGGGHAQHGHEHMDANVTGIEADPCFVAPTVTLSGLNSTMDVFVRAAFTWVIDNGTVPAGHSMLTSFRYATEAADVAALAGPDTWGQELVKKEHNNLPATLDGTLQFNVAGTYYVRAYAEVQGTGYKARDFWSDEVAIEVLPVQPTGVIESITHVLGPIDGLENADLDLKLGDQIKFVNEDIVDHVFTLQCPFDVDPVTVSAATPGGSAGESEPILLAEPGVCRIETDDRPSAHTAEVSIQVPQ